MKQFIFLLSLIVVPFFSFTQKTPKTKVFEIRDLEQTSSLPYKINDIEDRRVDTTHIGYILSGMSQGTLREAKVEHGLELALRNFFSKNLLSSSDNVVNLYVNQFRVNEEISGMSEKFIITYQIDAVSGNNAFLTRFEGEHVKKAMDATAAGNKALEEWMQLFIIELQKMPVEGTQDYQAFLDENTLNFSGDIDIKNLTTGIYNTLQAIYDNSPDYTQDQYELKDKNLYSVKIVLEKNLRKKIKKSKEKFRPVAIFDGEYLFLSKRHMGSFMATDFFAVENTGRFLFGRGTEVDPAAMGMGGALGALVKTVSPFVYDTKTGEGYRLDKERNFEMFLKRYQLENEYSGTYEEEIDFIETFIARLNNQEK